MSSSLSSQMYEAAASIWQSCMEHPFVQGIGDGSLPIEKFRYYMLQDYLYLFDYTKVFALGVLKTRNPELMRRFAKSIAAILDGEMDTHRAYMQRLGISEEQVFSVKAALDNLSYTHYMLSVANNGGAAEVVAAILSCSWSYAEIGQALAKIPGSVDHPFYGQWIRSYSSEDYAAHNQELVDLMDRLAADCTEEQQAHLIEIFINCSRYELGFWDMAWEMKK